MALDPGGFCTHFNSPQEVPWDASSHSKTTISWGGSLEALVCAVKEAWLRGADAMRFRVFVSCLSSENVQKDAENDDLQIVRRVPRGAHVVDMSG